MFYLALAYLVIWALLGGYLVFLFRKQKRLESRIENL
ncbi:MAG: CcmD family protein [Deltaproteobacteria bacterium]|nr:CcmD family protein [Deltaproteobacteria bacterium]